MVPPLTNRVRGKTREQRVRDNKRKNRANLKQAGKTKKPKVNVPVNGIKGTLSKKKIKKKEQRARLLSKSKADGGDRMVD